MNFFSLYDFMVLNSMFNPVST